MKIISKKSSNILKIVQFPFHWYILKNLSNAKFVTQTYIFVVIIPIISSVMNITTDIISFSIGDFSINIPVLLPSTWGYLFFASIFLLLFRIVVTIFMPSIIKYDGSISKYTSSGLGYNGLVDIVLEYNDFFSSDSNISIKDSVIGNRFNKDNYHDDFFSVANTLKTHKIPIRYIASLLFIAGVLILFILLINNIIKVIVSL